MLHGYRWDWLYRGFGRGYLVLAGLLLALSPFAGQADDELPVPSPVGLSEIHIDTAPPYVLFGAAPNFILSLDDSGSMNFAFLPDDFWAGLQGDPESPRPPKEGRAPVETSAVTNSQYYNPATTYLPPIRPDGERMPHACFDGTLPGCPRGGARVDPFHWVWSCGPTCTQQPKRVGTCPIYCKKDSCTLDLGKNYAPLWNQRVAATPPNYPCKELENGYLISAYTVDFGHPQLDKTASSEEWAMRCLMAGASGDCPAFYYRFDPTEECLKIDLQSVRPATFPVHCLKRVVVGEGDDLTTVLDRKGDKIKDDVLAASRSALLDPGEALDPPALAKRNFANWFSYYRTRYLTVQTVLSRVFADMPSRARLGYQGMKSGQYKEGNLAYLALARTFDSYGQVRRTFYDWLYASRAIEDTYLVSSALRVHHFCSSDQAYVEYPAVDATGTLVTGIDSVLNPLRGCRNNFHIVFTDGAWTDLIGSDDNGGFTPPPWLGNNDGAPADPKLPMPGEINLDLGVPQLYQPSAAQTFSYTDFSKQVHEGNTLVYPDANIGMLADVAFYSWSQDLRNGNTADAADQVPPVTSPVTSNGQGTIDVRFWNPANDLADWQHVTTFTVGFGLAGNVHYPSGDWTHTDADGVKSTRNIYTSGFPGARTAIGYNALSGFAASAIPDAEKIDDTWHAGINGRGGYASAADPDTLTSWFAAVVDIIANLAGDSTATAVTVDTGATASDDLLFQTRFSSGSWSGDLRSFQISGGLGRAPCPEVADAGDLCQGPETSPPYYKSAADELADWSERRIFTIGTGNRPVDFNSGNWDDLTDIQRTDFLLGAGWSPGIDVTDDHIRDAKAMLDYVAGDRSHELAGSRPSLRKRSTPLGDFINSAPVLVAAPPYYYRAPGYLSAPAEGGTAFKQKRRRAMVYAGANDGMLHAFDAKDLKESYAFVPPVLMGLNGDPGTSERPGLRFLSDLAYGGGTKKHRSYVDAPFAAGDVYLSSGASGQWHTVLIGGLGLGGQALYALDVTDPPPPGSDGSAASFAKSVYLWEISDRIPAAHPSDTAGEHWDANLGYVFGRPSIVRMRGVGGSTTPVWVAIVGNGYNSAKDDGSRPLGCDNAERDYANSGSAGDLNALCGEAVLYVIDIRTGTFLAKMHTGVGRKDDPLHTADADSRRPNALGPAVVIGSRHVDGDLVADTAYAADLFGNLWRFDLTGTSTVRRLFSTLSPEDRTTSPVTPAQPQPITAPLAVARHPSAGGQLVLFGTGQYLAVDDVKDRQVQSFYAIWDKAIDTQPAVLRSDLLRQEFEKTAISVSNKDGAEVTRSRTSTANTIDWTKHSGWYIDFDIEKEGDGLGANKGERVVTEPLVRGSRVYFVSLVPENNTCLGSGYGWINALDLRSGSRLPFTPFDTNLDGTFSDADLVDGKPGTSITFTEGGQYMGPYSGPSVSTGGNGNGNGNGDGDGDGGNIMVSCEGDVCKIGLFSTSQWRVWQQLP